MPAAIETRGLTRRFKRHLAVDAVSLTVPAKASILFDMPPEERLAAAMQKLGISFTQLSDVAGHA